MEQGFNRRGLIKAAGGLGAGLAVSGVSAMAEAQAAPGHPPGRRRTLRFAHLTDAHVKPERGADRGLIAALQHAQQLEEPPQFIFNGGDAIMDALAQTEARTRTQFDLWKKIVADHCGLPIEHCIGNHDVWGWSKTKSGTTGDEPRWGKAWALEAWGLERPYRSFDRADWHFVVLDSIQPREGGGYFAGLDDEQFDWLADDLSKTPPTTPVIVISHIPIVSVAPMFFKNYVKDGKTQVPGALLHLDAHRLKDLFYQHPNVKLCLSGHNHLIDRVEYLGVTYICDGAVSGAWWGGDWHECDEGYGVIDLFDDGSFEHQYITYGWTPPKAD